jgi:hypothetical protein
MDAKYLKAIELIDTVYLEDTEKQLHEETLYPKEYLYALRMVETLAKFEPLADEAQLLAARCQHFRRWDVPRANYPMDKKGYHAWRTFLYTYQASKAGELIRQAGYPDDFAQRVEDMVSKKNLKSNPDTQLIEDTLCLVFFIFYAGGFAPKFADDTEKLLGIVKKTIAKMSERGRQAVLSWKEVPTGITDAIKAAMG